MYCGNQICLKIIIMLSLITTLHAISFYSKKVNTYETF